MRYCLLALLLAVGLDARAEQPLAASTIVLYNKNVPDSVSLAIFYAEQRGIARDHLVGLECSTEEEVSREEYDATIANPLRDIFKERQWWTLHETPEQKESVTTSSQSWSSSRLQGHAGHFPGRLSDDGLCSLLWLVCRRGGRSVYRTEFPLCSRRDRGPHPFV